MTEEQSEHIKTLLSHEDTSFVQQGLALLETQVTTAETLCEFFGIEASNGFNPIAEQIVEWTHSSMVVAWLEQFATHTISHSSKSLSTLSNPNQSRQRLLIQ